MSCEELERLVKRIALGFVILFVSGFLVLYYAIRRTVSSSTDMYGVDILAIAFVISTFFISFLAYTSEKR